jgi:SH3-like domain-containing protein
MDMRLAVGAVALGFGWGNLALAEGDLARKAPPMRPADLIAVSAPVTAPALVPENPAAAPAVLPESATAAPDVPAPDVPARDPNRGAVTNLPLPRFVTLKTNEGNARRGPGLTHRIDWVFTRAGMPLRVTAEFENWRRIEDQEGVGGWVHYTLLSGARSALVTAPMADFRDDPDDAARVAFQAEMGVVGRLLECSADWCRMSVDGTRGWVRKAALWGVTPDETVE